MVAAGGGALQQYHQTALQKAEAYEKVLRGRNAYNRFAEVARGRIERAEKLKDGIVSSADEAQIRSELKESQEKFELLDKATEEAMVQMQKQMSIAAHYDRMEALWFAIAGAALLGGALASWHGFRSWLRQPANER